MADVKILNDNTEKFKQELKDKMPIVLEALGLEAAGNAVDEISKLVYDTPESPNYVRTGRLRNSIAWVTTNNSGTINDPDKPEDSEPKASPEENSVCIGTNVEYAPYVEMGTSKMPPRPYLRNAIANYKDDYKNIIEEALKA